MVMTATRPASTDREKRVRQRSTYTLWKELLEFLDTHPTPEEITKRIHQVLDGKSAYGSIQKSDWSRESLKQAVADREGDTNAAAVRHLAAQFVLGSLDDQQFGTLHLEEDVDEFLYERATADCREPGDIEVDSKPVLQEVNSILGYLRKEGGEDGQG